MLSPTLFQIEGISYGTRLSTPAVSHLRIVISGFVAHPFPSQ
jgi:hypothetical protein